MGDEAAASTTTSTTSTTTTTTTTTVLHFEEESKFSGSNTYIGPGSPRDHDGVAAGEENCWHIGLVTQLSPVPGMNSELFLIAMTFIYDNITDECTVKQLGQWLVLKNKEWIHLVFSFSAMNCQVR
jgi:hypothetical protein